MANIVFTDTLGVDSAFFPKPATFFVPDWYKNLESYIGGEKKPNGNGATLGTMKKCMPVFDAIAQGYIIVTHTDIYVSKKEVGYSDGAVEFYPHYEWSSSSALAFHPIEQAPEHPNGNGFAYPKWMNTWAIKTPKGYSTMFQPPAHRDNVFTILPGVVDTDTYTAPVNFPMVLTDPSFTGLIPAGTPIAQVIPFKREVWNMSIGDSKDLEEQAKVTRKLRTKFFDSYKSQFRQKKEYK
jgi:hypothetical protein